MLSSSGRATASRAGRSQSYPTRLFHCSVHQCPKVGEYPRRFRRIHHALREEDADHSLCGVGIRGCTEPSGPTETAGGVEDFVTLNVYRHSEAPAGKRAKKDFRPSALVRREVI